MAKNELTRQEQCMSSLDIAAVTGKPHKDVLKAIRTMEPAWEKECGRNFSLTSEKVKMPQGGVRLIPERTQRDRPSVSLADYEQCFLHLEECTHDVDVGLYGNL